VIDIGDVRPPERARNLMGDYDGTDSQGQGTDSFESAEAFGQVFQEASTDAFREAYYSTEDVDQSVDTAAYGQQFYPVGDDTPATIPPTQDQKLGEQDDAFVSVIWDVGGAIPLLGTPISALSTAIDVGAAGLALAEGDTDQAWRKVKDAGLDAIGIIPVVGNVVSAGEAVVDGVQLNRRDDGVSAIDSPTVSDAAANFIDNVRGID
jgi:hypothetical protein